jgi:23S rRNA (cytosine1962-C5)-methyltransferase
MRVGTLSAGKKVLNLFSFSGGFSLYAARGGARQVTDVDISAHALAAARRNFALNLSNPHVRECQHLTLQADVFDWLQAAPERGFDLIVLDPPSLAKRASERPGALEAYRAVVKSASKRLGASGTLVAASCSAHVPAADFFKAVRAAAASIGRPVRELGTSLEPPDHPAAFPEAAYLKCIYLQVA